MQQGIFYAIVTAIVFGFYSVFHERSSSHINSLFGAIVIAATALILGLLLILPKLNSMTLHTHTHKE